MRRDGGSVFPAHANTGDPNGPIEASTTRSNQRPDTLMQDRSPPAWRNHLQRTAGPYIRVKLGPRIAAELVRSPAHSGPTVKAPARPFRAKAQSRCAPARCAGARAERLVADR